MTTLSLLIAKRDWNAAYRRLQSAPEECSMPISTGSEGTVYVLHQAICVKVNPVPRKVLINLLEQFPNALDLNVFIGASQNPQSSRASIEILLDRSSCMLYESVEQNAQRFAFMAIQRKNISIVQLFIDQFPAILNSGAVLTHACIHGTAAIVQMILAAGHRQNVGKAGGLYLKTNHREDALDTALRLYDENDDNRRNILINCLQYANAAKMGTELPQANYPVLLAAIGLVPQEILKSFLNLYKHEITNTAPSGRDAILKVIQMSMNDNRDDRLPQIFQNESLISACRSGKLDLVQRFLETSSEDSSGKQLETISYYSEEQLRKVSLNTNSNENALDVALDLFNENDNASCEILKLCVQYANAAKIGKKVPSSHYPTLIAAIGLIPQEAALKLGIKYHNEIKNMDNTGKLAVKKVLKMTQEETRYANRLDARCQYPLSISGNRMKLKGTLEPIKSQRNIESTQ